MTDASAKYRRSVLASCLLAIALVGAPLPGHATDTARIQQIAAELNVPRRAWTICTVNEVGRVVQAEPAIDAAVTANRALAACAAEQQALRTKAVDLLGVDAAERLMTKLEVEAHEALVASALTLAATKAAGAKAEPAWPRVVVPAR